MDKAKIKKFAIEARQKLIADITLKMSNIGVSEHGVKEPLPQSNSTAQFFDVGTSQPFALYGKDIARRQMLVNTLQTKAQRGSYATAYKTLVEEVAYTWFNRLIAIRFMEVNDYLPGRVRVLSSHSGKPEPDLVTTPFDSDLQFTAEEAAQIRQLAADSAMDELFQFLFIKQCNALNPYLPELFEKTHDYAELLLNVSYIKQDSVVYKLVHEVDEANFDVKKEKGQVEIIGWLYQYYNTEPKDETFALLKKNVKITKERIPAATQLFTPDWIVRYMAENSLGRLWMEAHPNSPLQSGWQYYLEEAEQEADVQQKLDALRAQYKGMRPEEIKVLDPCMGSGHILVYAFDLLLQMYESAGYSLRDGAKLILENNLYGFDIDYRAYQLAYFALLMKARAHNRRILNEEVKLNLSLSYAMNEKHYATQVANAVIDQSTALNCDKTQLKADIAYLLEVNRNATEFGSLLRVKPLDFDTLEKALQALVHEGKMGDFANVLPLVKQARILAGKYDVVITNPPYMGGSGMSAKLADYMKKEYPDSKSDMFAAFIERCGEMCNPTGFVAMITQHAWMFLSSYEKLRAKLLGRTMVNMAHLGARAFDEIGGEVVQATAFVQCMTNVAEYKGTYARLVDYIGENTKREAFLAKSNLHTAQQNNFEKIPGMPVAYWVSENFIESFKNKNVSELFIPKFGMSSGDGDKFIRFWYEVGFIDIGIDCKNENEFVSKNRKWNVLDKGGSFRRWYGNKNNIVWWSNNGKDIKSHNKSAVRSPNLFFKPHISWTLISSFGARYFENGFILDTASNCLYFKEENNANKILAFLNCIVATKMLDVLNPTLNFSCGVIAKLPVDETIPDKVDTLVTQNISLSRNDWDSFETSWDFKRHPFI